MWDTCTSHFGPKKFDRVGRGRSGKVKIWPRMGLAYIHFWLRSLIEAPKWVKDTRDGPKMIPPIAPDWFESISGVLDPFRGLQRAPKPWARPILDHILTLPWSKMASTDVPHIVLHVLCSTRTSGGYFRPSEARFRDIFGPLGWFLLYIYKGPKYPQIWFQRA